MKAPIFEVRNAAGGETQIDVLGSIAEDAVSAQMFARSLGTVPAGNRVSVRINSPGGDVFEGLAIHNLLAARGKVRCQVLGLAASAASVVAMAGRTVMARNALLMCHDPTGLACGGAGRMRKMAGILEKVRDEVADIYARKCGKDVDTIKVMMAAETWFTGAEAVEYGLADEATEAPPMESRFDLSIYRHPPPVAFLGPPPKRPLHGRTRAEILADVRESRAGWTADRQQFENLLLQLVNNRPHMKLSSLVNFWRDRWAEDPAGARQMLGDAVSSTASHREGRAR
jgi:ATP-dependent protease ClpP protease subunit